MGKAKLLIDEALYFNERYRALIKVYEVTPSKKFPEGIKARFVLIDLEENVPRLLVDNHEPFGFHIHTALPHSKEVRVKMTVSDYLEALQEFKTEALRIVKDED